MTKLGIFSFVLAFLLLLALASCRKYEEYPPEPEIGYVDFVFLVNEETGISENAVLSISYRDGDGDIGLEQSDTLAPYHFTGEYHYNLIIKLFERQNGVFVEMPYAFNYRIPPLIPKDQKKSIKGIIENELPIYDPNSSFDTIRFTVKVIDRALNISNEVTTPAFVRIVPRP